MKLFGCHKIRPRSGRLDSNMTRNVPGIRKCDSQAVPCKNSSFLSVHSPGEVPLRMNSHIYEQRAEDEQVGPVINSILYQRCFNFPSDGEASRAGVGLHEGQQQPANTTRWWFVYIQIQQTTYVHGLSGGVIRTTWDTGTSSTPPSRTQAWCHLGCSSTACSRALVRCYREEWEEGLSSDTEQISDRCYQQTGPVTFLSVPVSKCWFCLYSDCRVTLSSSAPV